MIEDSENQTPVNNQTETELQIHEVGDAVIDNNPNNANLPTSNIINEKPPRPKGKRFLKIMIGVMLLSIVGLIVSISIFGMPNTASSMFNLPFLNNQTGSTLSPSTEGNRTIEPISQPANSCGDNMVKLIKTANTIGGSETKCFPNTDTPNSVDFSTPLKTVNCPAGLIMSQAGSTETKTVTVDCKQPSSTSTKSTTSSREYSLNQKVTFSDGVSITITALQRNYLPTYSMTLSGKTYTNTMQPASGKEYIAISLKIDNGSGKTYDYGNTYGWRVEDSNKFQYDEAVFVVTNEDDLLGNGHLGDGGTVSGKILYEIPSGSSDLKLIIGTATFNLQ